MPERAFLIIIADDARLSPYATGNIPIWLWSADATRILWGNPAAAAIFRAPSTQALTGHTIDPKGSAALQIARLAGSLPHGAAPRLERLRGFGGRFGGALMCACSRVMLADETPAILVVATEAVKPFLSQADQAQRLLAGHEDALALFAPDGTLLNATPAAAGKLGHTTTLAALGAASLGAEALAAGRAEDNDGSRKIVVQRIGSEASTLLLVRLDRAAEAVRPAPRQAETAAPAPEIVAAEKPAAPAPAVAAPSAAPAETQRRRQPLRFVWQSDDAGRFTIGSDEFIALVGPKTAAALGQRWEEIAATLCLDPEGQVARALASRDTWSGITVSFPVDGTDSRLPVVLSGLPVFDRDRNLRGYRGFGVCRAGAPIAELAQAFRSDPPAAPRGEPPVFHNARPAATPQPNVVPFPATPADSTPALTPIESSAFNEIGSRLTARLRSFKDRREAAKESAPPAPEAKPPAAPQEPTARPAADQRPILDRLPVGVLVYRLDKLIYANRAFLDWTGYENLSALEEAGGLDALFVENGNNPTANSGAQTLSIATHRGDRLPVEARLFTSPWEGESALVLMLASIAPAPAAAPETGGEDRQKLLESALRTAKAETGEARAILETATDGVVVLDREAHVLWVNGGARTLFGYDERELTGLPFTTLFAEESGRIALDTLNNPRPGSRDVIGRRREGGLVPLSMTVSKLTEAGDKHCVLFRDMTSWKKTESELLNAKRQAEKASAAKSDFLAKMSHEIRTPLNAIIGFSEVMMQERFGPIGNERYKQYLKDIHASGGHLVSLLNDLLDLSKIEAGKLELNFASVDLNEVIQQGVALMQPQANRERIIIRTSLGETLPQVTADVRSVRQILLNLLSNSIKFTGAGGQVIVSTARGDGGDVVMRVRDTGVGMSDQDLAIALEPFRQLATSARFGSSGTGLGLPLTKALAEANRASFRIKSGVNSGTLVEVAFRGPRMAAE